MDNNVGKVISVLEEFASIEKQIIETGKVRIIKSVTEETATVHIPITNESYQIRHLPGGPELLDQSPPSIRKKGDTTIISVIREVSVVVIKYELIEEIHIIRNVTQTSLTQEITLRKEHVDIQRIPSIIQLSTHL